MHLFIDRIGTVSRALIAGLLAGAACAVAAHGAKVGDIAIGHPFATPSVPGAKNGAAYLASIENKGESPTGCFAPARRRRRGSSCTR